MLTYPEIDPVLLHLGPLKIRWYGLMYVFGFIASYFLVKKQIRDFRFASLAAHFENLNIVLIISIIIGGRLGYVLFYNLPYYLEHPLQIPATWSGGMSFHGAAIGLISAGVIFCRLKKISFWKTADIYVVTIPIGLGLGRFGNFINAELFGRATELPWGMVFPGGGPIARHPSQLYEVVLEGVILFILLWANRNKPWRTERYWPHGSLLALFLIGYGVFRTLVEFFREPDPQIGIMFNLLTMGQLLSCIMILGGTVLWILRVAADKNTTDA
jgi:phosphatidylglycerol:prolipoprotein diacylglycerol transferase